MFLVRKVTRAKWDGKAVFADGEIPADAITIDLKTTSNTLSFWRSPTSTASDLDEVALAIAANRDRAEKLQIVFIDLDEIQTDEQVLENIAGDTPVTDMKPRHVDICRLDYVRLGKVARRVANSLDADRSCTYTKLTVTKLVARAVEQGRVRPEDLKSKLWGDVSKMIEGT